MEKKILKYKRFIQLHSFCAVKDLLVLAMKASERYECSIPPTRAQSQYCWKGSHLSIHITPFFLFYPKRTESDCLVPETAGIFCEWWKSFAVYKQSIFTLFSAGFPANLSTNFNSCVHSTQGALLQTCFTIAYLQQHDQVRYCHCFLLSFGEPRSLRSPSFCWRPVCMHFARNWGRRWRGLPWKFGLLSHGCQRGLHLLFLSRSSHWRSRHSCYFFWKGGSPRKSRNFYESPCLQSDFELHSLPQDKKVHLRPSLYQLLVSVVEKDF